MPKQIKELRQFLKGTASSPASTDTPDEAPVFSLNLDPLSEEGKLKGNKKSARKADNTTVKSAIWNTDVLNITNSQFYRVKVNDSYVLSTKDSHDVYSSPINNNADIYTNFHLNDLESSFSSLGYNFTLSAYRDETAVGYNEDLTWRGTYDASTAYIVNDAIVYNNDQYVCIQDGTGQTPNTSAEYWKADSDNNIWSGIVWSEIPTSLDMHLSASVDNQYTSNSFTLGNVAATYANAILSKFYWTAGEHLKYGNEIVKVNSITSVQGGADTISVNRGCLGTLPESHTSADSVYIPTGYRYIMVEHNSFQSEDIIEIEIWQTVDSVDSKVSTISMQDTTDYLDLNPKQYAFLNEASDENTQIKNDLVYYSLTDNDFGDYGQVEKSYKIKVAENFYEENDSPLTITDENWRIPNAPEDVTMQKNANALFIGTGNQSNSKPQWFGKINHKRFGNPYEGYHLEDGELLSIDDGEGMFTLDYQEYFLSGPKAASYSMPGPVASQDERFLIGTSPTYKGFICINNDHTSTRITDDENGTYGALGKHFRSDATFGDTISAFHQSHLIFADMAENSPQTAKWTSNSWDGTDADNLLNNHVDNYTSYAWTSLKGDPSKLYVMGFEIDVDDSTTSNFGFRVSELSNFTLKHGITVTDEMNLHETTGNFIGRPPKSGAYISDIYELNDGSSADTEIYLLYSHPAGFTFDEEWLYVIKSSDITAYGSEIIAHPVTPPAVKIRDFGKGSNNIGAPDNKSFCASPDVFDGNGLSSDTVMGFNGARKIYANYFKWRNCDQLGYIDHTGNPHVSENDNKGWKKTFPADDQGWQNTGVDVASDHGYKVPGGPNSTPENASNYDATDPFCEFSSDEPEFNKDPNITKSLNFGNLYGWDCDSEFTVVPVKKGLFRLSDNRMEIGCLAHFVGTLHKGATKIKHYWSTSGISKGYHMWYQSQSDSNRWEAIDEIMVVTANSSNLGVRQRFAAKNATILTGSNGSTESTDSGHIINGGASNTRWKNAFRSSGFLATNDSSGNLNNNSKELSNNRVLYKLFQQGGTSTQVENDATAQPPINAGRIKSIIKDIAYYQNNHDELMLSARGPNPQNAYIYRWTPANMAGNNPDINPVGSTVWSNNSTLNPVRINNIGPSVISPYYSGATETRIFMSPLGGIHQNGFVRYDTTGAGGSDANYLIQADNVINGAAGGAAYEAANNSVYFYKTKGGDLPVGIVVEFRNEESGQEDLDGDGVDTYKLSNFNDGQTYFWKIGLVYDGYQEGPLTLFDFAATPAHPQGKNYKNANLKIYLGEPRKRVSAITIYRKNTAEEFYRLIKEVSLEEPWPYDSINKFYYNVVDDEGFTGATYQAVSGVPESLEDTMVHYKLSTVAQGNLVVADCWHPEVKNAQNFIFKSQPNAFSTFDWAKDFCVVPDVPTCIQWWAGKLYAFDLSNTYTINVDSMALEDTFEGVGCIGPDSILVTDVGMFFCDYSGIYWHNGQKTENIGRDIYGDSSNVTSDNWHDIDHKDANGKFISPKVLYDPRTESVLFAFSNAGVSKAWVMSLTRKRWDLIEVPGAFGRVTGSRNDIYLSEGVSMWELFKDSSTNKYSWYSKTFDFGNSSIQKRLNKVKIVCNSPTDASNLIASNVNKDLVKIYTDNVEAIYNQTAHENIVELKINGASKKGYLFKFQLSNIDYEIDSISMIYSMGSIK
tara:strand:- start:1788 stop:6848 length:5061 start_codon:yes stop_codon:yes gene_type:complete